MHIRANKFYPPQVGTPLFLLRERIVGGLARRCGAQRPTVIVEAQPGQGKTTCIRQFLDRLGVASVWYQVGPEEADPAFLLLAIPACIAGLLPDCPSAAGMKGLTGGDIALFDLPKRLDLLLGDLRACLKDDLYIVFDDLHNLIGHESSLFILNYLVENAPPRLRFVLSSREPLPLDVWRSFPGERDLVRIGNRELALDEYEVAEFFHKVFDLSLSHDAIRTISGSTDGWVMGVLLLGLAMVQQQGKSAPVGLGDLGRFDMLNYFRRKVFTLLEPRLHGPLLQLSLLEEIPVALAQELTEVPDIGRDLEKLAQRNIFIRPLDPDCAAYGLHHLFRQFLREKAKAELRPEAVERTHRQAGWFFFRNDNPAQALRSLLEAREFAAMETVLQKSGMAMLAANQSATLADVLGRVPQEELSRLGWAAFFLALAHLDVTPARALPLLSKAQAVFCARQDEHGELLCLAHIISIHITTTGHYREGVALLARAEGIFARIAGSLDASATVLLARSLAMGRCIFLADTDTATRYAMLALNLARSGQLVNFESALLMVMGYIRIFAGHMPLALIWLEQAAALASHPEVGTFNNLATRMMLFNFLFHDGDFTNYYDQKRQLVEAMGREMVSQSIAGPFCYVWEMDIALCKGRFEDALDLAAQALAFHPPLSPHVHSQVLQLQAVALARLGRFDAALDAAAESARLRDMAAGLYFVTLNTLLLGLVHGLCGRHAEALALLTQGIKGARAMPSAYLECCGLLHRGAALLAEGDRQGACRDIEAGLGLMRRNTYRHFWAWTPQAAEAVLGLAVAQGIEADYARTLAAERIDLALLDDGAAIPLIEVRTLGDCAILHRGAVLLAAEELTPTQRELLCLLLASPGLRLAQETAQLHFWPDSSPAAAKAKFDTLVSRLRKALAEVLPAKAAHRYINREKGIVWLAHCRVDALDFLALMRRALEHSRLQEFWQAGNAFTRAEALWQGEFAPGITGEDTIRAFRDTLGKALAQGALVRCGQLAEANRLPAAIELAEKALRSDPLNDALWGLLYSLHGRRSSLQARQVLNRFAAKLRAEDYSETEIAESLRLVSSN